MPPAKRKNIAYALAALKGMLIGLFTRPFGVALCILALGIIIAILLSYEEI